MKKHWLLFSLLFLASISLFAQGEFDFDHPTKPYLNTVSTATPLLLIAPDARSASMGDLGVATSPDNYSQHHNPAKYVFNDDIFGVGVSYSPWLKNLVNDIHLIYLASFWKITDNDAIAFSLRYFSLGEIQFTDKDGYELSKVDPNEFALDFTYSRRLSKIVSMAITPRFIYSNLTARFQDKGSGEDLKAGLAGAVDISLFVNKPFEHNKDGFKRSELMFGFNISNIGNKVSYSNSGRRDFLPCNMRLGLSYAMSFDDYNKLAINVEAGKMLVPTPPIYYPIDSVTGNRSLYGNGKDLNGMNPLVGIGRSFGDAAGGYKKNPKGCFNEEAREVVWSIGAEYSYRDLLFVRAGTFLESKYKGNRKFATVGVGVKYNIFAFDVCYLFAFGQHHPLENTLRFSLTFLLKSFNKEQIKNQNRFNRH